MELMESFRDVQPEGGRRNFLQLAARTLLRKEDAPYENGWITTTIAN